MSLTSIHPSPDALSDPRSLSTGQAAGGQPTASSSNWAGPADGAGTTVWGTTVWVYLPGDFHVFTPQGWKVLGDETNGLCRVCWLVG